MYIYRNIFTYQENLQDRSVTGVFWIVLCAQPLEPLWNLPEVRRQAAADGDAAREADALRVVTKARQDHFRLVTWEPVEVVKPVTPKHISKKDKKAIWGTPLTDSGQHMSTTELLYLQMDVEVG